MKHQSPMPNESRPSVKPSHSMTLLPYLCLDFTAFAIVGWNLSLDNVMLFSSIFLLGIVLWLSTKQAPWLHGFLGYIPQTLTVVMMLCLLATLTIIAPILLFLVWIPLTASFLLWQEMRFEGKSLLVISLALVGIGLAGIVVGELVDLYFLPSPRL